MEYREQRLAEREHGVAKSRPQDDHKDFLCYLRTLNNNEGIWRDWPAASKTMREKIQSFEVPASMFSIKNNDPSFLFDTQPKITYVDSKNTFDEMMSHIKFQEVISLDYEFHHKHSYNGLIALMQLSTMTKSFVLDPFPLRKLILSEFVPNVLQNNKLIKIMCGSSQDILMTQSNFGVFMEGMIDVVDLYKIWRRDQPDDCYNIMKRSIEAQLKEKREEKKKKKPIQYQKKGNQKDDQEDDIEIKEEEIYRFWKENPAIKYSTLVSGLFSEKVKLDKGAQHADFRVRPLRKLLSYAVDDVHYLIRVFFLLKSKLSNDQLQEAFNLSNQSLLSSFKNKKYTALSKKLEEEKVSVDSASRITLEKLYKWRDDLARSIDENPEQVISFKLLVELCKNQTTVRNKEDISGILKRATDYDSRLIVHPLSKKQIEYHVFGLLTNDQTILAAISSIECHNCFIKAHCGWQCPYPKNPHRHREYYSKREHQEEAQGQKNRRNMNTLKKTGKWYGANPPPGSEPGEFKRAGPFLWIRNDQGYLQTEETP